MDISTRYHQDEKKLVVDLPEKFVFSLHGEFRDACQSDEQVNTYCIDMGRTKFMDSSALGMILQLKEKAEKTKSDIKLQNVNCQVKTILQIAHFDHLFEID